MLVVEETGVPAENHRLTPSHWQISKMPRPAGIRAQAVVQSVAAP